MKCRMKCRMKARLLTEITPIAAGLSGRGIAVLNRADRIAGWPVRQGDPPWTAAATVIGPPRGALLVTLGWNAPAPPAAGAEKSLPGISL